MIALLVMTDGRRECITRTVPSALAELGPAALITERWIHDDSGDPGYRRFLRDRFPAELGWTVVGPTAGRSGFGGAIRSAWQCLRASSEARYIFHLEDDFTFRRSVNLAAMAQLLDDRPWLLQVALRRQPWNADERAAGGIVEQHPADYHERRLLLPGGELVEWLEHRRFFTTNPCLYRRDLVDFTDWPDGSDSEGRYSIDRFKDPDAVAGFFGSRDSGEWVEHIGRDRVGTGY
jgi:hypothetical protein